MNKTIATELLQTAKFLRQRVAQEAQAEKDGHIVFGLVQSVNALNTTVGNLEDICMEHGRVAEAG
jgi:hypothetical protein